MSPELIHLIIESLYPLINPPPPQPLVTTILFAVVIKLTWGGGGGGILRQCGKLSIISQDSVLSCLMNSVLKITVSGGVVNLVSVIPSAPPSLQNLSVLPIISCQRNSSPASHCNSWVSLLIRTAPFVAFIFCSSYCSLPLPLDHKGTIRTDANK